MTSISSKFPDRLVVGRASGLNTEPSKLVDLNIATMARMCCFKLANHILVGLGVCSVCDNSFFI